MKAKRFVTSALALIMVSGLLQGCGRSDNTEETMTIEDNTKQGMIDYETATTGIDSNSKDFADQLVDQTYYVVHEGIYYPLFWYYCNEKAEDFPSNSVNPNRYHFLTTENITEVPTFFPGDHIVYYSKTDLLDHIVWERYYDIGTTFGIYNLESTSGGRYYINLSQDEIPIVPGSELNALLDLNTDVVSIDKIGGVVVDDSVVQDGFIVGATKGKDYDMEAYTGTTYNHYTVTANVEAFKAYELYASTNIETLQDCFWEIEVPEYLADGYYNINLGGFVRIVNEPSYSEETDFNKQVLFVDVPEYSTSSDNLYPRMYSDNPNLNCFTQTQYPEELGYVNPDAEETVEEAELPEAAKFKEANVKTYELWFPEGRQCEITITSKSGETAGSAVVKFDTGGTTAVTYNRFDKNYTALINGKGNMGVLEIGGFWYDYDIELRNVELYNGQDMENPEAVDSDNTEDSVSNESEDNSSENVDETETESTEDQETTGAEDKQ